MNATRFGTLIGLAMPILAASARFPAAAAQTGQPHSRPIMPSENDSAHMAGMADHVMSGPMGETMMKHMELTPLRTPTHDDSVRAIMIASELRQAISKYQDTAVARA